MNRLIAAIIAVCYLCLSTGFTLHVHYCMGKIVSRSLTAERRGDDHKCPKCGMEKKSAKKGCCKDEYKVVKAKSEAAVAKAAIHYNLGSDALSPDPVYFSAGSSDVVVAQQLGEAGRPHGPPLVTNLRLHVRNCVFLI